MRLQLLAGLAAAATAVDQFEDDDVNFLRFLSSNMSVNASGTAAPTTTTGAANTTTGAPTTTTGAGNTTTGAPTTTTGAGNQTTGAPTTTMTEGSQPTEGPSQTTPAPSTVLCSTASYAAAGLAPPATMLDTMAESVYEVDCSHSGGEKNYNVDGDSSTAFYSFGSRATPQANKDKCPSPSTLTTHKCGDASLLTKFNNEGNPADKQGIVQYCCGASPGFAPMEVLNFLTDGTASWGNYSDAQCSTPVTAAVPWPMSTLMTSNPKTFTLGACVDGGIPTMGAYIKMSSCNTTHIMMHRYLDSGCANYLSSGHLDDVGVCKGRGANNTAYYEKWSCTATAPATKQFSTTLSVDFGGLAGLSTTQLTAIKEAYEPKSLDTFKAALNNADATVTATHAYTGALATRRRLAASRRRLSGTGGVSSVFVTELPAAAADTAQAAIVTATTGAAALTPATFKSTIETELQTNAATTAFASNITATVAAPVVSQTTAVQTPAGGGGGGSTSGAMTNLLGLGSALAMAVAILF